MNNPKIAKRLASEFVPFAGATEQCVYTPGEAKDWYLGMGHKLTDNELLNNQRKNMHLEQGIWIAGADGSNYGWINSREPEEFLKFLDQGLEKYKANPPKPVQITQSSIEATKLRTPDLSTSIIRSYYRIYPLPKFAAEINEKVNWDHFWVFREEVAEILAATKKQNENVPFPRKLVARLTRFHLLDNVRGLATALTDREVTKAKFSMQSLGEENGKRTIRFQGEFAGETQYVGDVNYKGPVGVDGKIEGLFEIDLATLKITKFCAYAEAQAWGANDQTWDQPEGKFPLAIAFRETDDELAHRIPPVWTATSEKVKWASFEVYKNPTLAIDKP